MIRDLGGESVVSEKPNPASQSANRTTWGLFSDLLR